MADSKAKQARWEGARAVASRWERAHAVANAGTENFAELIKLASLDPKRHLRFADWSGITFRGCDLRGFDFTGARLIGCDFKDAMIKGAQFDYAEFDMSRPNARLDSKRTNLRASKDWNAYLAGWRRAHTQPSDDHLTFGTVFQDSPLSPEMVVVPAGTFMMGTSAEDFDRFKRPDGKDYYHEGLNCEAPQHRVLIDKPFAVGRFPVTVEEWTVAQNHPKWREPRQGDLFLDVESLKAGEHFVEVPENKFGTERPNSRRQGREQHPMVNVTWDGATAYVRWLTAVAGKAYRLLSEAEWEYCCRAGSMTAYNTGDTITKEQARFSSGQTIEVGSFPANAWGLYDMHGNVREWCQDEWHETYEGAPGDGSPWESCANSADRVFRGGAWFNYPVLLRSARRDRYHRLAETGNIGFRVGRTLTT
jgi:formylglycine-generating enzyme required for sulfatase activity